MGEGQPDLFVASNKLHAERQPFAHILDIDWSVPLFLFTIYVKKKYDYFDFKSLFCSLVTTKNTLN